MTVWSRNIWNTRLKWHQCMSDDGKYDLSPIEALALLTRLSASNPSWVYEIRGE